MTISEVKLLWTGWNGGPGYTNLYVDGTVSDAQRGFIRTAFAGLNTRLPNGVIVQVPNTGKLLNEATGQLTGLWSGGAVAPISGTAAAAYPSNAGMVVLWRTSTVANNRFVQGRSFLVPMAGVYDTDGTIGAAHPPAVQTLMTQLITDLAGALRVWRRPVNGVGGSSPIVTSAFVPDMAATLRSRRGRSS